MQANPYVGPRSFTAGERLYGRDRELRKLTNLLIAERIVLLYSPSGAGKTSLVQAALLPRLAAEGFRVLPTIRVSAEPPPELPGANRYLLSALSSLEEGLAGEDPMPLARLAELSLEQYLALRAAPAEADSQGDVLIFDQFEELLSLVPNDRAAKEQFFEQVGAALRSRERWALFSMREDYIAQLDPYLRPIPTRLANTFRLDLLGVEAAMAAVQEPARAAGVAFAVDAAQQLVDDLRMVRVQQPDGSTSEEPGLYVEPVQLQVVCYRLWDQLPPGSPGIDRHDLGRIGDVTVALRAYYAERVAAAAAASGVGERAVRDWFEQQLITGRGIRGQLIQEPAASGGLGNAVIFRLIDSHLVRGEKRRGATWFELAHDRLIRPVLDDNAAWREANLNRLQRQADLWDREQRQDGLLLREAELAEAEAWAAANPAALTAVEQEFLARCREVRAAVLRERRTNRLIRALAVVASVVGLLAMIAAFAAYRQGQVALVRQLAAEALSEQNARPQRDLLLALEASRIGAGLGLDDGEETLQQLLTLIGGVPLPLAGDVRAVAFSPGGGPVAIAGDDQDRLSLWRADSLAAPMARVADLGVGGAQALSPDGSRLAVGDAAGLVRVWDTARPAAPLAELRASPAQPASLALSGDGALLAIGGRDGVVRLWPVGSVEAAVIGKAEPAPDVTALALSRDGARLAVARADKSLQIWQLGAAPLLLFDRAPYVEPVSALEFSPDNRFLAVGSADGVAGLWRDAGSSGFQLARPLLEHTGFITALTYSADGRQLASASRDGTALLWETGADREFVALRGHEGWLQGVAFSPDGGTLLTAGRDGALRAWSTGAPEGHAVSRHHDLEVSTVAFSRSGALLATGSIDGSAALWRVAGGRASLQAEYPMPGASQIWGVALSPDEQLLATASADGVVRLWPTAGPAAAPRELAAHVGIVTALAFQPDGGALATAGDDGRLLLWSLDQPAAAPRELLALADGLRVVAFSPDGQMLAAAGEDGVIYLWRAGAFDGAPQELRGHDRAVWALDFSPEGGWLASGGFDARVRLWDLSAGTAMELGRHGDWVMGLSFSRGGRSLASASNDNTVQVWEAPYAAGQESTVLRGHSGDVIAVDYSPDGDWLISGGSDSTFVIWPVGIERIRAAACVIAGRELRDDERQTYLDGWPAGRLCE